MGEAGWGIVITLLLGIPTLLFAYRATRVSEQTLALEQRRDHADKQSRLEFTPPYQNKNNWRFMSRTNREDWFV